MYMCGLPKMKIYYTENEDIHTNGRAPGSLHLGIPGFSNGVN